MITIDIRKAITALSEAVEAKGSSFVYQRSLLGGCAYVHYTEEWDPNTESYVRGELKPGCLVGDALIRLGVPAEEFLFENQVYCQLNTGNDALTALSRLRGRGVLEFDEGVDQIFQAAQNEQDDNKPWGVALKYAKAKAYDVLVG